MITLRRNACAGRCNSWRQRDVAVFEVVGQAPIHGAGGGTGHLRVAGVVGAQILGVAVPGGAFSARGTGA